MHTKSFFPFYQGNKANTAPTEALCLLIALQQQPWQTLIQRGWCGEGSKAFPTAFKSGFVSAFAILGTMGLQQHAGFLKVISTFWEKQHFFMGSARQRGNSAFSMSFFFFPSLWSCVWNSTLQRGTWQGQEGGMQYLNGTCAIPLLSILMMSLKGHCHLSSLDMLKPV